MTVMTEPSQHDAFSAGDSYEQYMGRWSRQIAAQFVDWLALPPGLDWVEVGCGTGALSATILDRCKPRSVLAFDQSAGFIDHARTARTDPRARFEVASASELPAPGHSADVVASALAYNFFPDRPAALSEMQRVAKPGGAVAFYVWDYPDGGMGLVDAFWAAAMAIDPGAAVHDERARFPFCTREALLEEVTAGGLVQPDVRAIEIRTRFDSFDTFWQPFTLGAGPCSGYYLSLDEERQRLLREKLKSNLGNGAIDLPARAWALRGRAR
jgi:SAM-dependent methyltransferase